MLPLIVVLLSSFVFFVISRLLISTKTSPIHSISLPKYVYYILSFIGVALIVINGICIHNDISQKNWPTVQGRITKADVVGGRIYIPEVVYTYKIEQNDYYGKTDLKVPYFGPKSSRKEVAYKSIEQYKEGSIRKVYYNPENPSESYLKPSPTWDKYTRLSLGTVLYGLGLLGLLKQWLGPDQR